MIGLNFKHTFWPSLNINNGWLNGKFHLMSVCLSYHQLKTLHGKVSLSTDLNGYNLLINDLQLDYIIVNKNLEGFETIFNSFWVLKKLYSLAQENKPFLNVDCDFYFFKKLEQKFSTCSLIAQNYEFDHPYYIDTFNIVNDNFAYVPDYLKKEPNGRVSAINAGVIGGTNTDFFKIVFNEVRIFIEKNQASFLKYNNVDFNMFLEQFFIKKLSEEEGIGITYLKEEEVGYPIDYSLDKFYDLPKEVDYLHTMNYKTNPLICEQIAQRLYLENPILYYRCIEVSKNYPDNEKKKVGHFNRLKKIQKYIIDNEVPPSKSLKPQLDDLESFEFQIKKSNTIFNSFDWEQNSISANKLLSLPKLEYLKVRVKQSAYFKLILSDWDWSEKNHFKNQSSENKFYENLNIPPSYFEVLLFYLKNQDVVSEYLADPADMFIFEKTIDFISMENLIEEIFSEINTYQPELDYDLFSSIVLSRIKIFIYLGLFQFE